MKKKWILLGVLFVPILLAIFIKTRNTIEPVEVDDIQAIEVERISDHTFKVIGKVNLDLFETVAFVDVIEVDQTLFISINKRFGVVQTEEIVQEIGSSQPSIEQVILIGGNFYTEKNGFSHNSLKNVKPQRIVWE